jgi:hypothetical protein
MFFLLQPNIFFNYFMRNIGSGIYNSPDTVFLGIKKLFCTKKHFRPKQYPGNLLTTYFFQWAQKIPSQDPAGSVINMTPVSETLDLN